MRPWHFPFAHAVVPHAPPLDHPSNSSISVRWARVVASLIGHCPRLHHNIVPVFVLNAVDVIVVDAHASVAARSRSANATNVARRGGEGFWGGKYDDNEAVGRKEERWRTRMRRMRRR